MYPTPKSPPRFSCMRVVPVGAIWIAFSTLFFLGFVTNSGLTETPRAIAAPNQQARTLTIVPVSAPKINCIFDSDCQITVRDTSDQLTLPGATGTAFLQSRTLPIGERGAPAAGLYGHEYRVDLRKAIATLAQACISTLSIDFGSPVPLDYDQDGKLEDVYVVTRGGIGNIAPSGVTQVANRLIFRFSPSVCAGTGGATAGDSTFFFGMTSKYAAHAVTAQVQGTPNYAEMLDARAPNFLQVPTRINIPLDFGAIDVDGFCDGQNEYQNAIQYAFAGRNGQTGRIYLKHTNKYLHICAEAPEGVDDTRMFGVYIDQDNGQEALAEADDFALRTDITTGLALAYVGSANGYVRTDVGGWTAIATHRANERIDVTEQQIPLPSVHTACGTPFGIALYHHLTSQGDETYGFPTNRAFDQPQTWVRAVLNAENCPLPTCTTILDKPTQIPTPAVINFNEVAEGTVLANRYRASHGVRFEDGKLTQAVAVSEAQGAIGPQSPPQVAVNVALTAIGSDDVPMRIAFDTPKTHVGMFLGNGDGDIIDALLTAYDAANIPICEARLARVPRAHDTFLGLEDTAGRIAGITLDYGGAMNNESIDDLRFAPPPLRRIQVCQLQANQACTPAPGAVVYRHNPNAPADIFQTDRRGYVIGPEDINPGDALWARYQVPFTPTHVVADSSRPTLLHTSGTTTTAAAFNTSNTMALTVAPDYPLLLQNIDIAAQWNLEGTDQAALEYKNKLAQDIVKASDFLYDFTNGQFALGSVNVYQNYDNWDASDVWLHADNNQRPLAVVGGIVVSETYDVISPTQTISYNNGHVYMGSQWNRYNEPPDDPDIDTTPISLTIPISDDWSVALAHELSHYMLFQWDVYFGLVDDPEKAGEKKVIPIETCTGSAMGNVYFLDNTEFISDTRHWNVDCKDSHAHQQVGERTEWETIQKWYGWAISPTMTQPGPIAPPVQVAQVNFTPPLTPTEPLPIQPFTLRYVPVPNQEDVLVPVGASDRARAYLMRNNRIIEQGQPPEGGNTMTLTGAQATDRFCLFDIKNIVAQARFTQVDPKTGTRHQYGCKILDTSGSEEYALDMARDVEWEPVIEVTPRTTKTLDISVTLPISAPILPLMMQIYPEHQQADPSTQIALTDLGEIVPSEGAEPVRLYAGTFAFEGDMTTPPSAHLQLWVTSDSEAESDPRREAVIGYGVGGAVVPGPAHFGGHVPIISPDGDFIIVFNEAVTLRTGEFIAIQEPYALPKLPPNATALTSISGYRLIALPQTIVTSGAVSLRYLPSPVNQIQAATRLREIVPNLTVYFWNGSRWTELETTIAREPNGYFLASAPIDGVGIYALLVKTVDDPQMLYLPIILR